LDALALQQSWHINDEDPLHEKSDIVDSTALSCLKEYPDGPRTYAVGVAQVGPAMNNLHAGRC